MTAHVVITWSNENVDVEIDKEEDCLWLNVGPVGTHETAKLSLGEWRLLKEATDLALEKAGMFEEGHIAPLVIPLERLGEREILAFRTEWLSGKGEDGLELTVDSSAGFGGDWFALNLKLPDGRRRTDVARITKAASAWANRTQKQMTKEAS